MSTITFKTPRGTEIRLTKIEGRNAAIVELPGKQPWTACAAFKSARNDKRANSVDASVRAAGAIYYLISGNWSSPVQGNQMAVIAIPNDRAEEVRSLFGYRAAEALTEIVEECCECGATYTSYGNLRSGGMGCVRCD